MPENSLTPRSGLKTTPFAPHGEDHHPELTLKPAAERAIQEKFEDLGGTGVLGVPVSKEEKVWTFAGESCICYNEQAKKAFEVHGAIYGRWAAAGREKSYLGYPTSDEVDFSQGGRANDFQGGGIYWWGDTGAIDLPDVVLRYTGLYCFGETDSDQSSFVPFVPGATEDEPYVILSVATPEVASTQRTRIHEHVNSRQARSETIELYRGRPYGINISAVLMESDFGDPDKYRQQVQDVVDAAHSAGVLALNLIPFVGPFVASQAGPRLGELMPAVGSALNKLFDWGDDRIGSWTTTIHAREMVLLAAKNTERAFEGIVFELESDLISGDGASYKVYFSCSPVRRY